MDISIDELKNPECQNNLITEEINEKEETAQEFKKRLGKKISEMNDEEKKKYNSLSQQKKRKQEKQMQEGISKEETTKQEEDKQNHLYNQLFLLKQKFPENTENIHIDPDMTLTALSQKKDLIMKVITDKHSHNVVFETLLLGCRSLERTANYFNQDLLDGFANETSEMKDDIVPILKEMIDLGEIDTSMLTPQLRLAIVMSSVVVKTIEKNNDKKKNAVIVSTMSEDS
jgi:hypothetical protein